MPLDLSLDIAAEGNAEDWVRKSRIAEKEKAKKLAEKRRKQEEDDEVREHGGKFSYGSKDLSGIHVMHDASNFDVGEEVILTLADTNILAVDDQGKVLGVNDEGDILENIKLSETDRIDERAKNLKRSRQPLYSGYDDDEFQEGGVVGSKASLLAQYDADKARGPKFVLGDQLAVSSSASEAKANADQRKFQSLQTTYQLANDFVEPKDIKFKKVKKSEQDAKRRRVRERSPEREGEGDSYDLGQILGDEEEGTQNGQSSSAVAFAKPAGFNGSSISSSTIVLKKEKEAVDSKTPVQKKKVSFFANQSSLQSFVFEDEDPELAQAMARARQSAILARSKEKRMNADNDEEDEELDRGARNVHDIAVRAAAIVANAAESKLSSQSVDDIQGEEINLEGRRSDGKLIFNSTTEFAARLQARQTDHLETVLRDMERGIQPSGSEAQLIRDVSMEPSETLTRPRQTDGTRSTGSHSRGGGDESSAMQVDEQEDIEGLSMEDESMYDANSSHAMDTEDIPDDEQLGFLHRQPLVSRGMAATLDLLKSSGELRAKSNELAGRSKDSRTIDPSKAEESGVKIEYRDKFGRKLTQKEAFRQLCYTFHGYGPGKKKQEKRLKAMKQDSKQNANKTKRLEGNSGTMKSLTKTLEATGQAHITVQGGVHASDALLNNMAVQMLNKKEKQQKKHG